MSLPAEQREREEGTRDPYAEFLKASRFVISQYDLETITQARRIISAMRDAAGGSIEDEQLLEITKTNEINIPSEVEFVGEVSHYAVDTLLDDLSGFGVVPEDAFSRDLTPGLENSELLCLLQADGTTLNWQDVMTKEGKSLDIIDFSRPTRFPTVDLHVGMRSRQISANPSGSPHLSYIRLSFVPEFYTSPQAMKLAEV